MPGKTSHGGDKARILTGKPPVPVGKALESHKFSRKKVQGMKTAIVIGAGFGGLALAIRLAVGGRRDHAIVEARDKPGGRGYYWEKAGLCTFDAGPTVVTDPPCLRGAVGTLSGQRHGGTMSTLDAGDAILPAQLARRHQFRLFE